MPGTAFKVIDDDGNEIPLGERGELCIKGPQVMKDTALVSVIGLEEIMRRSQIAVTASKEPFTFYMVAAFIYLGLTVLAMIGLHFLEKRASRGFVRSAS